MPHSRYCLNLLVSLTILILAGCSNLSSAPYSKTQALYQSGQTYLQLADVSPDALKMSYRLQASKAFLLANQLSLAKHTLEQINPETLDESQQIDYHLTNAQLNLLAQQSRRSLSQLRRLTLAKLNVAQRIQYYQISAEAYRQLKRAIASIKTRIKLSHLLHHQPEKQRDNQQAIWDMIQSLPKTTLINAQEQSTDPDFTAWLQLALITTTQTRQPSNLIQALNQWQQRYPGHAANALLPDEQLDHHESTFTAPVKHIALLLPLTGDFAKQGNAIKNGFMAAYYQAQSQQPFALTISFHDTETQSAGQSYRQAVDDGADFVIGPLRKNLISDYLRYTAFSTPIMLLNYPDEDSTLTESQFAFGLSPLDEINQMAKQITQNGQQHTLLIYPETNWGKRLAKAYHSALTTFGGDITDEVTFDPKKSRHYATTISHLLRVNQSIHRKKQLDKFLHEKVKFSPRIRQDSDAIFLIANAKEARQLKPLLRFYYASHLPVYAASTVYSGRTNPRLDRDLNGIHFFDIPWIVSPTVAEQQLQKQLKKLWPDSYKHHPRLYALGVDAYHLIANGQINLLPMLNRLGIAAVTGKLSLKQHRLHRQLQLTEMFRGRPIPLL